MFLKYAYYEGYSPTDTADYALGVFFGAAGVPDKYK